MDDPGFDLGTLLKFALPLLWLLGGWLKKAAERRPEAPPAPRLPTPAPVSASPRPVPAAGGGLVPRAAARTSSTNAEANAARKLQTELASIGGRADALMGRVDALGPRAAGLAEVLRAGPAQLATRLSEAAADPRLIAQHRVALMAAHAHLTPVLDVLEAQLAARAERLVAERLSDAEAIFDDLWAPLAEHAANHDIDLPPMRPLAFPTPGAGGEAVITGLLPSAHPLLFVPPDFSERLLRWPSLAHELGHLMHEGLPGLPEELSRVTGWRGDGPTPGPGQASIEGLQACIGAWRVELFCDVIATLLLGPAALAGFVAAFRREDDPSAVLRAEANGRALMPHPPAHLRVMVSHAVLESMELGAAGAPHLRAWRSAHGLKVGPDNVEDGPDVAFLVPRLDGQQIRVAEGLLLELVLPGVERLLERGLDCLAGHRFIDVPGLTLSASGWRLVERTVAPLRGGEAVHQRPRVILCAAILASQASARADGPLSANLHRCIIGRLSEARQAFGSIGAAAPKPALRRAQRQAAALRGAMVLREALNGPRGGLLPAALRTGGRPLGHRPPAPTPAGPPPGNPADRTAEAPAAARPSVVP